MIDHWTRPFLFDMKIFYLVLLTTATSRGNIIFHRVQPSCEYSQNTSSGCLRGQVCLENNTLSHPSGSSPFSWLSMLKISQMHCYNSPRCRTTPNARQRAYSRSTISNLICPTIDRPRHNGRIMRNKPRQCDLRQLASRQLLLHVWLLRQLNFSLR